MIEPVEDEDSIHIECSGTTERPDGGMGLLKLEVYPIDAELLRPLAHHLAKAAFEFLKEKGLMLEEPIEVTGQGQTLN